MPRSAKTLPCVLIGSVAVACSVARMQVPAEIATRSDLLVATNRSAFSGALANESFKLGPYAVKDVDRKWDVTTASVAGNLSRSNTDGGYAFRVEGAGALEQGHCASAKKDTDVRVSSGLKLEFQFAKLACSCDAGKSRATVVVESSGDRYFGALVTSAGSYRVTSVHDLEGGAHSSEPLGYRIDGEAPIAAAEIVRPGRAWLDRTLDPDERAQIACLVVGLMLYAPKDL